MTKEIIKKDEVKIIQAFYDNCRVLGLGDDGLIYAWVRGSDCYWILFNY